MAKAKTPKCRASVVGIHPVKYSEAYLREMIRRWNGPDTTYESKADFEEMCDSWRDQIRDTMQDVYLIELALEGDMRRLDVGSIAQDSPLGSDSQVPYDEHWLSEDGSTVLGRWGDFKPNTKPVRVAFFLHRTRLKKPLFGLWGKVDLPKPTRMPKRLAELMPYDVPT